MSEDKRPNPGSDEALALGCLCPVLDNGHGRGSMWGDDVFVFVVGCPVHDVDRAHPPQESPK